MIMYMSDILCITNRKLCLEDFLTRMERIAGCGPVGIILREKDLSPEEYLALAKPVMDICGRYGVHCILHSFIQEALKLHAEAIHLPLHLLRTMTPEEKASFSCIGASCHSVEDALEAQALGCSYITAGHIFATDCKKGLPGRGLDFLQKVCSAADIPVYAIGGITPDNIKQVRLAGASGACLMSSLMAGEDIPALFQSISHSMEEPT